MTLQERLDDAVKAIRAGTYVSRDTMRQLLLDLHAARPKRRSRK